MPTPSDATAELDRVLPRYQFSERHHVTVGASVAEAFDAIAKVDLPDSRIARVLQSLWRIPARLFMGPVPNRSMSVQDFIPLVSKPPRYVVRGLVSGAGRRSWTPEEFIEYPGPGFKLAWGYAASDLTDGRARIDTETRVWCCDDATKRWFALYWLVIRPWSGLIRRDLLRIARLRAESTAR